MASKITGHTVNFVLLDTQPHCKNPSYKKSKRPASQNIPNRVFCVVDDPDKDVGFNKKAVLSSDSVESMLAMGSFTESTILSKGLRKFKVIGNQGKKQTLQVLANNAIVETG